jgi:hypothetical protein
MFIKKILYLVGLFFLTVFFIGIAVSSVHAEDTCTECHKDPKFRVQNPVLFNYYKNWKDSTHELEDVTCIDCHGGDPTTSDKKSAHDIGFLSLTSRDRASFKMVPEICSKCHAEIFIRFTESKHYKSLVEKGTGPNCSTCHGSVNVNVYYTSVIARACKDCHNEYTGNRPEIVGEADKILHRINVAHALKGWIMISYKDEAPVKVDEILALYDNVAQSWHTFDSEELDHKSEDLTNKMKSLLNRKITDRRKKAKKK